MSKHLILIVAAFALLVAASAAATPPEPQLIHTTQALIDQAFRDAEAAVVEPGHDWENQEAARDDVIQEEDYAGGGLRLLADDNDTAHYARGHTLIVHIFINHSGGTWSSAEKQTAIAKAQVARQYFRDTAPNGANVEFDNGFVTGHWEYNPTIGYNIATDGMSWAITEDALAAIPWADSDGDGSRVDDLTTWLQNWNGGYDNAILVFQPADRTGRAFASYGHAKTVQYTDDAGSVWTHEMGHSFGACDEYAEGGQCNGGIDCGLCQSWYLAANYNNGNCDLNACPSDVTCLMRTNNLNNLCAYTPFHWAWGDAGNDGWMDVVNRRVSGNSFVNIYHLPNNGWYLWNSETHGYEIHQQYTHWAAAGVRSPSTADYDIWMYGDNNHNYLLANSRWGGQAVDFVVGDYNHNNLGNENIWIDRWSGASDDYRLHWEGGTGTLYPDGIARNVNWTSGGSVVRTYDVPLFAGETITFLMDITSGSLDMGMALFRSSGDDYFAGRSSAQWIRDNAGVGGTETWTYTVPADDVYGLVVFSNSAATGTFTLQIGPTPATLAEETVAYSAWNLRLYNYDPNAIYWSVVGNRPDPDGNTTVELYNDVNYTSLLETSNSYNVAPPGNIDFVAADYNHVSGAVDYVRVIDHADIWHRTEWEHDGDLMLDATTVATWDAGHVNKVWDMYRQSGQQYFFREYSSGALDTAMYLFTSGDGDYYKRRGAFTAYSNSGAGSEYFWHTATANNWDGLVQVVHETADTGTYSIWAGAQNTLSNDGRETIDEDIVFNNCGVAAGYWNVFGARPSVGSQSTTVWLYGDEAYTSSTFRGSDGGSGVNFIVGDFNHNAAGTERMLVRRYNGTSEFDMEFDGGNESFIFNGSTVINQSYVWPALDVAEAIDLWIYGGDEASIQLQNVSAGLDLGMALFKSSGATYYASSNDWVARSDGAGNGGDEAMTYTAPSGDWHGLVIWNNNRNGGTFDLQIGNGSAVSVDLGATPSEFAFASSPNPFRGSADIQLALPQSDNVDLAIYDVSGRLVKRIESGRLEAGHHSWTWDGRDESGEGVAAGVYLARAQTSERNDIRKLIRIQ